MPEVNLFAAGAALADERRRLQINAEDERLHEENIRRVADAYGIGMPEAQCLQDFRSDILGMLFFMADDERLPLELVCLDGSPTTREQQFDIIFGLPHTCPLSNLPSTLRTPSGECVDVKDLREAYDKTYISVRSLHAARTAIVGNARSTMVEKDRAIRQVLDDFVRGVNEDDSLALHLDAHMTESIWEWAKFGRPSNEDAMTRMILEMQELENGDM